MAGSEVTLHNLTGRDLLVAHVDGPGLAPLLAGPCGRPGFLDGLEEPRPFRHRALGSDGVPEPGRPRYEYWVARGDAVTFTFDGPGDEVRAEVWLREGAWPRSCQGLLVYPLDFPWASTPWD